MSERTVVVGATTWGTTLALVMAGEGRPVTLLTRDEAECDGLRSAGENPRFLPGVAFPPLLAVSANDSEALSGASLVVIAVPSDRLRENARRLTPHLGPDAVVVSATKGLELPSAMRMSETLAEELPSSLHAGICALSGPNLAKEIVQGRLASTVIASASREAAELAQRALLSSRFRVYTSSDVTGVELGGALKNIVALGAGICDGLEVGENAKAAFITRGLAEIARLGEAAGACTADLRGPGRSGGRDRHLRQPSQPKPVRGRTAGPRAFLARDSRFHGQCGGGSQRDGGRSQDGWPPACGNAHNPDHIPRAPRGPLTSRCGRGADGATGTQRVVREVSAAAPTAARTRVPGATRRRSAGGRAHPRVRSTGA